MSISIRNISKKFGETEVLKNIDLDFKEGSLTALLGPSGSGKTTLLRIIAGLEFADSGKILLDDERTDSKSAKARNIGFVFQHYALFKNMTVFDNIAFGLTVRPRKIRPSKEEIKNKVTELLKLIHLSQFHDRYPSQLSGGQRQRVALARALAVEPKFLLLDEPFGALDAKVRKELRLWLRHLHDQIDITTIFVTHDQEEALEVADKIVIMSNGKIEQIGDPNEVYRNPHNMFVYDFLGDYNELEVWRDKDGNISFDQKDDDNYFFKSNKSKIQDWSKRVDFEDLLNKISFGIFGKKSTIKTDDKDSDNKEFSDKKFTKVKIFIRPHEITISKNKEENQQYMTCKVLHINWAGFAIKLELEYKNHQIIRAEITREILDEMQIAKGDLVFISPKKIRIFD